MQLFLLLLGVFACATSVIWIKLCTVDPVLLSGLRLAIAAVVLTPLFVRDWRRHRREMTWQHYRDAAIPGVALTLHFFTWIYGARFPLAANSTLLVNLVPIVMPFLLAWLAHESVNRKEILATMLAMAGLAVLFVTDYQIDRQHFHGDLVCLGSMVLMAFYLALGRRRRHHPTVWLYMVPLYYTAALVAFACAPFLSTRERVDWAREWPLVLALGLIPTVIGHSLLNNAMRFYRGQVVALATMLQFVFAGVIAYFALPDETPHGSFYLSSALIVTAGAIAVRGASAGAAREPVDADREARNRNAER